MDLDPRRTTAVVPLGGDDLVIVATELQAGARPGVEMVLDGNWAEGETASANNKQDIREEGGKGQRLRTGASDSLLLANGPELVECGLWVVVSVCLPSRVICLFYLSSLRKKR